MTALTSKLAPKMPCYWCAGTGEVENDGKTRIALVVELPDWHDTAMARELAVTALVIEELDRQHDLNARRRIVRYMVERYMEDLREVRRLAGLEDKES